MKVRRFKMLRSPQLPSPAKLILQLCLQADVFGLYPAYGANQVGGIRSAFRFLRPSGRLAFLPCPCC